MSNKENPSAAAYVLAGGANLIGPGGVQPSTNEKTVFWTQALINLAVAITLGIIAGSMTYDESTKNTVMGTAIGCGLLGLQTIVAFYKYSQNSLDTANKILLPSTVVYVLTAIVMGFVLWFNIKRY